VKLYQTVLSISAPEQFVGSPVSMDATTVSCEFAYGSGDAVRALAKLSLAGGVPQNISIERRPGTASTLPTWMR
jgi:hypothetical protein